MKEASFYATELGKVRCSLCNHRCLIADGKRGLCGVRENSGGTLNSLVYGKLIAQHVDPIEKKPLYHFQPGSMSYSIATVGCNFRCDFCQNWEISQRGKEGEDVLGSNVGPEHVVQTAVKSGCKSVSYTYTEPTVYFEYAYDTSKLAAEKKLKNIFVSNGYTTQEALNKIKPYLHAANIDLKSFSDRFYREICGARLEPVLENLRWYVKNKIWLEVTTLIVPGQNDSREELKQIADFIKNELAEWVPWHVSRFYPHYMMEKTPPTDLETVEDAYNIGKNAGLKYVYTGNTPHQDSENTSCPSCGKILVERFAFNVDKNNIVDGKCPKCGTEIEGVWS